MHGTLLPLSYPAGRGVNGPTLHFRELRASATILVSSASANRTEEYLDRVRGSPDSEIVSLARSRDELDLEVGRFLSEHNRLGQSPPVAGSVEYLTPKAEARTLGIPQSFVPNQGDARQFSLHELDHYL